MTHLVRRPNHTRDPCSVHAKCSHTRACLHTHHMHTRAVQRACPHTHAHAHTPITHASRAACMPSAHQHAKCPYTPTTCTHEPCRVRYSPLRRRHGHGHASRAACMPIHTCRPTHPSHTRAVQRACQVPIQYAKCPYTPTTCTHEPCRVRRCMRYSPDTDMNTHHMHTRAVQRACPHTHVHAYKPITHASRAAMPTHMCVPPHARAKTNPDTRAVQRACPYTRACLHTHHTHPSHAPTVCGVSLTSLTRTWLLLVEAREAVGSWVVLGRRWSLGDISNLKTQIVL